MTEDFDESNLLDYQGYVEDEISDFKQETNKEHEEDESIDDESSEVGWNSEDEKKYYTKNIDELNESYIIDQETEEEMKDEELDEEIVHEEKKEELKNDELHIEIVDEEQHAWYYGIKEEIVQEEPNVVYESFTPEKKPLVQEEINDQETNSNNKKCFWGIIWDFINIFSK